MPPFLAVEAGFYERVLETLHDGVYFVDRDRRITYWNRGAHRITGYASSDVLGRRCDEDLQLHSDKHGATLCLKGCPVSLTLADGETRERDLFLRHHDGHCIPVRVRVAPIHSEDGELLGAVETFSDNSAKLAALERAGQLEKIAYLDALTGVGNRRYAEIVLEQSIDAYRQHGAPFAILFCDIDRFKQINDSWGHQAGDAALRMVAQTLAHNLRSYDFIARWGGDEFLVVVPDTGESDCGGVARRCLQLVRNSHLAWNGERVRVTISIGLATPQSGDSALSLLRRADDLLYEAKDSGRDRFAR